MQESEKLKIAYKISESSKRVPVNDILEYIEGLENSGVGDDNLESMVSTIIKNESSKDETHRRPDSNEILIYELPKEERDLILSPC